MGRSIRESHWCSDSSVTNNGEGKDLMSSGKTIRMNRLMKNGRTLIAAMDHTRFMGPVSGGRTRKEVSDFVRRSCEFGVRGVITTPLILQTAAEYVGHLSTLVSVAGGTTPYSMARADTELCLGVRQAVLLGADCIYFWCVTHRPDEKRQMAIVAHLAEECRDFGLPLVVEAMTDEVFQYSIGATKPGERELDAKELAATCRIMSELGADVVKTHYPGTPEGLREIVETALAPVVIAGGPAVRSDDQLFSLIECCMENGVAGFALGRSFFQHAEPEMIMRRVSNMIFG